MIVVSGCLAGIKCKYNGTESTDETVVELVKQGKAIPVCPEQLGGLPTPRPCCEFVGDRVLTTLGIDVSEQFLKGAEEGLRLAKLVGAKKAILKSRSPSCGYGKIYDGTFSGKLIAGDGLFAAMLKENGITVESV
ncbi:Uncharacterized conserved protein YbbK, DUF523 family [Maridesulfovibrio ferrireducens]|uniref:Uncharacterized conserved protein YbbK, DUF523 family n=1 Tax=Maridesulfovibrio ferrireducens TaxID=246191 RepID=A0A1G9KBE6_9BACT|nr:DUF523 domain-containing protein [Maridesulfovibrio ferrireducens]SDL47260.1 Uncharacterized conserved protein YbbK, DUF523 family [Maridesulfovibrio ferrireducens]